MTPRWITCGECGKPVVAGSSATKYCPDCAAGRRKAPPRPTPARGVALLRAATPYTRRGPEWANRGPVELLWQVMVDVPFTWAFSKNHIYSLGSGRVHLRSAHKEARDGLTARLRAALNRQGTRVATNKVWIDILVEKDSHRGDAINVVDGVCDAIKKAIPVDDRWYGLRRLDWEVIPNGGRIYVAIGQDSTEESQVCHACGQILPLPSFSRGASACTACAAILRAARKRPAAATHTNVTP